jgi:hypothetical protein
MANRRDDPLSSVPRQEDVRAETRQREPAIGSLEGTPYRRSGLCRPAIVRGEAFTLPLDQKGILRAAGAPDGVFRLPLTVRRPHGQGRVPLAGVPGDGAV